MHLCDKRVLAAMSGDVDSSVTVSFAARGRLRRDGGPMPERRESNDSAEDFFSPCK